MAVKVSKLTVELRKMEIRAKKKKQAKQRKISRPRKVGNLPKSELTLDDVDGLEKSI